MLRLVNDKLGKLWNQRVTIENKPGGGGFIAIDAAAAQLPTATPCCSWTANTWARCALYKSRNFVPLQHFDPGRLALSHPFLPWP